MRFSRRNMILLHSDVQLMAAALKPDSSALFQIFRFFDFRHTKYGSVKFSGLFFALLGGSQLNMVDSRYLKLQSCRRSLSLTEEEWRFVMFIDGKEKGRVDVEIIELKRQS